MQLLMWLPEQFIFGRGISRCIVKFLRYRFPIVPCSLHFGIENGLNEWHATPTSGSRFDLRFDFTDRLATVLFDATRDHSLCDIVARTYLCSVVEISAIVFTLLLCTEDESRGRNLQW